MTPTAHRIFKLLGVDAQSPQADYVARERLKVLNVYGLKCRRCDGSGKYRGNHTSRAICYNCNGRGVVGIAFTKLTLQQLEGMAERGTLDASLCRWKGLDMLRNARADLASRCAALQIESLYDSYNARHKPVGDWNRDLYELHASLRAACHRVEAFPGTETYPQLCQTAQERFCQDFQRTYSYAQRSVEGIKAELEQYLAAHTKPDFRQECLKAVGDLV